jgi:hypothetical protein
MTPFAARGRSANDAHLGELSKAISFRQFGFTHFNSAGDKM